MKGDTGGWWKKIFIGIFGSPIHGFLRFSPARLTEQLKRMTSQALQVTCQRGLLGAVQGRMG